ncbi:NADP-dependent phosphogluconate dehydrogenase [Maribacter polysaccharolyticus]|uniref:NADP-dependent phosphogluconate dehydrogenase n=1 Tax=Maribacter polysaccharolyticus TaxID=3020831 RepID=UPI00237F25CC|nr:NADP-dependent phosphogluconate dehydrogenase [Maribacter polysaccharolyticus]MDE3740737.1 NADP-dependent phosphogluconate dehydrogenase [Maribacter polysaccharolyticus]
MRQAKYDIGLIGLGVMGRNLILNIAESGFSAYGLDLDGNKVASLLEEVQNTAIINASADTKTFVEALSRPRKLILLVPAGPPVDTVIEGLLPYLEKGDIIIDGGNSHYKDTDRRESSLRSKGIYFMGTGISGGAQGARQGPCIMPGGPKIAYASIKPILEAVAADFKGEPCVAYLGPKSAGNYVKMVHNGIEYGLMQLTSEIYDLLKKSGNFSQLELHKLFDSYNKGRLRSFLIEITANILKQKDDKTTGYLVDMILDKAKQKGTGKWTSQNAMDLGIPVPTIDIAVSMRQLSALRSETMKSNNPHPKQTTKHLDKEALKKGAEAALYFGFMLTYAQGFHLMTAASKAYGYDLNMKTIAKIWRAGCIIKGALLEDLAKAFDETSNLPHLLMDKAFAAKIMATVPATRDMVILGIENGIPLPGLGSALTYFDGFSADRLPLNLIQAQRDYFGSHTYERTDRDGIFHTDWDN